METDLRVKAMLRFASSAFPATIIVLMGILLWRRHFEKGPLVYAIGLTAWSFYLGNFCSRRSRGLRASFFASSAGPDSADDPHELMDNIALWGTALIAAMNVWVVFNNW